MAEFLQSRLLESVQALEAGGETGLLPEPTFSRCSLEQTPIPPRASLSFHSLGRSQSAAVTNASSCQAPPPGFPLAWNPMQ